MVSVIVTLPLQTVSQNTMMDYIQIWHVHLIGPQGVPYFKVTLNSQ